MEIFKTYLKKFSVPKGTKNARFGDLKGGLYYVPTNEQGAFWKLYCSAIEESNAEKYLSLVYRPPKTKIQPLCLDIDIRTEEVFDFSIEYSTELFRQLDLGTDAVFVQKESGYWKTYKNPERKLFCTSSHIYVLGRKYNREEALKIRERAVELVPAVFKDIPVVNPKPKKNVYEEIVDLKLPARSNGLMLVGSYKGTSKGGQYLMKEMLQYTDGGYKSYTEPRVCGELLEHLYSFVFAEGEEEEEEEKTKKVCRKPNVCIPLEKCMIDIAYYLEISDKTEDHDEWLQLLSFCKSNGVDKDIFCDACNSAYKPDDPNENGRVWDTFTSDHYVGLGSIIRLLQIHASKPWEDTKLFPAQTYHFHNEHKLFTRGAWTKYEIRRFFREVYNFCYGNAGHTFLYKEKYLKNYKNKTISLIRNVVTDQIPFGTASTDKIVMLTPGKSELFEVCERLSKKKPVFRAGMPLEVFKKNTDLYNACITAVRTPIEKHTYKSLAKILTEENIPTDYETKLSVLFLDAKQRSHIDKEFVNFDIFPYLFEDKSPTDCYNLWSQFELVKYMNDKIDVKETKIWRWLWNAWADKDEYKMSYYLSIFAWKVQFPWIKFKKFLTLFGEKGSGKSSCLPFATALLGKDRVKYLSDINQVFKEQNSELVGVLLLVVDDVETMKKATSDRLKTFVTADYRTIKKLYENPHTMRSYLDIIATSNSENPVYCDHSNRRDELGRVNDCLKGDKVFWDAFYEELEDLEVMGSWFRYLAFYKDILPISYEDCRLDKNQLEISKLKCMKTAHRFVIEFFQDPLCFELGCRTLKNEYTRTEWFRQFYINKAGSVHITKERTYLYYTAWCLKYKYSNVRLQTFLEHLKLIGLEPSEVKKNLHGKRLANCFTFERKLLVPAIAEFYKCREALVKMRWSICDADDLKELKKYRFGKETKLDLPKGCQFDTATSFLN